MNKASRLLIKAGLLAGVAAVVSAQNCFDPYLIFPERLDEPEVPEGAPSADPLSDDLVDFTTASIDGCTDIELTGIRKMSSLGVQSIASAIEGDETGHCPKTVTLASSFVSAGIKIQEIQVFVLLLAPITSS